jgi:hypothetical protein
MESIIVSYVGYNGIVMIEMMKDNETYHIRTYESIDHAIARYENLFELWNGVQQSAEMGTDYRIDPRIHVVEGNDVSSLIRDDVVHMEDFRIFGIKTSFGVMIGASAMGPEAEKWHGEGIAPGLVKI